MESKAQLNYLHIAPRKVRLVTGLIRGIDVKKAEVELTHLPKRSASPILKLLKSAVANAKQNLGLDAKELYVKEVRVNQGPVLKRFRPRAFGRAAMIRKRTSHVLLVLGTKEGGKLKLGKKKKKEGPVVRELKEIEQGALKAEETKKERGEKSRITPKPKSGGFVKRMFRRKAI